MNDDVLETIRRNARKIALSGDLHKLLRYELSDEQIQEVAGFAFAAADALLSIATCGPAGAQAANWVGASIVRRLRDLEDDAG